MLKKVAILNLLLVGIAAVWLLVFSSSANSEHPQPKNPFAMAIFNPSKANIPLYGDYRAKWSRMTGFELSSLHWNQFVAIFINQSPEVYRNNYVEYLRTSQDDYDEEEDEDENGDPKPSKFKQYPVGTMLAKEGYSSHKGKPGEPTFLVIMKKREKGYDPASGNWEYMQFAPDGTTMLRGKGSEPTIAKLCSGCHINVADRDYIFSSFFSGSSSR